MLVALAVVIGLAAVFAWLTGQMLSGRTRGFDRAVTYFFRQPPDQIQPSGADWVPVAMTDLSALGSVAVLALITGLAVVYLLLRERWRQAVLLAIAIAGGMGAGKLLKELVARPRPEIVPHLVEVTTLSFPSGHATYSAVVYLTLAGLLASGFRQRRLRIFFFAAGASLTVLIGITRVYLGVHYPSDVIAGWLAGATWALAMSLLARMLQFRHAIEPPQ